MILHNAQTGYLFAPTCDTTYFPSGYYVVNANSPDVDPPYAYLNWLDGDAAYQQWLDSGAYYPNYPLSCYSLSSASGAAMDCYFDNSYLNMFGFCLNLGNHAMGYDTSQYNLQSSCGTAAQYVSAYVLAYPDPPVAPPVCPSATVSGSSAATSSGGIFASTSLADVCSVTLVVLYTTSTILFSSGGMQTTLSFVQTTASNIVGGTTYGCVPVTQAVGM